MSAVDPVNGGRAPLTRVGDRDWLSYHLYASGDRRDALGGFLRPLLETLFDERFVDGFFFIRYVDSTGPHFRLRLRLLSPDLDAVAGRASARLERYRVGREDGDERSMLVVSPFELELERYGGAERFAHSLDFFGVSSAFALDYDVAYGQRPRAHQRTLVLCVLQWQAWGFARTLEELLSLLDYRVGWRPTMGPVIAHADAFFDQRRGTLVNLVRGQLEALLEEDAAPTEPAALGSAAHLCRASRLLSHAVWDLDPAARHSIGCSQLHMTGNRLGLTGADESYVSQLLCRAVADLSSTAPELCRRMREALSRRKAAPPGAGGDLEDLLRSCYLALFPPPGSVPRQAAIGDATRPSPA